MSEHKAPMPTAEGLAEPLRSRWSPSVFDDEHEVDDDQLETLLRAAQWAPSWGNSQPWRFFVARRGDTTHGVLVEHLSRGNSTWVPRAAVVLITATQLRPDEDGEGGGEHAAYDLGQAAAHITLQAASMGLHAHQFAGFDRAGRRRAPRRTPALRGDERDRDRSTRRAGRRRRAHARPRGPGPPSQAARGVRVRRLLGHTLAGRVNRRRRRGAILIAVLVLVINLPILHSTWTGVAGRPVRHGRHRRPGEPPTCSHPRTIASTGWDSGFPRRSTPTRPCGPPGSRRRRTTRRSRPGSSRSGCSRTGPRRTASRVRSAAAWGGSRPWSRTRSCS